LSVTLFEQTALECVLACPVSQLDDDHDCNQLILFAD
jgi:hypothetical protein